jgi:hypothetical protein
MDQLMDTTGGKIKHKNKKSTRRLNKRMKSKNTKRRHYANSK